MTGAGHIGGEGWGLGKEGWGIDRRRGCTRICCEGDASIKHPRARGQDVHGVAPCPPRRHLHPFLTPEAVKVTEDLVVSILLGEDIGHGNLLGQVGARLTSQLQVSFCHWMTSFTHQHVLIPLL